MNNEHGYQEARLVSEPELIKALNIRLPAHKLEYEYIFNVIQNSNDEDAKYHADIKAQAKTSDGIVYIYIDVKDVDDNNLGSGNYCIKESECNYIKELSSNLKTCYWFAFRHNTHTKRLNSYTVVRADYIIDDNLLYNICCSGTVRLYSLKKIQQKCIHYIVESDI